MESGVIYNFHITNCCTCEYYDEIKDAIISLDYCDGSCWDYVLEDFSNITKHLFDLNDSMWWKVSNLKLWDGEHHGYVYAEDVIKLITGMTVDSEWTMRGEIYSDCIKYSLSHHDSPTGSNSVVTIVSQEEIEKLVLY
jgi:hypothetical protein